MDILKQKEPGQSSNVLGYCFAATFLIIGLYVFIQITAKPVFQSFEARNWQATPIAQMSSYVDNRDNQPSLKANYSYEWNGQSYKSDRVFFDESVGLRKAYYRRMKRGLSKKTDVWVNPKSPEQSVIYRYVRWDKVLVKVLFSSIFLGLGFGVFNEIKRDKRENARKNESPNEPWTWPEDWQSNVYGHNQKSNLIWAVGAAIVINIWGLLMLYVTILGLQEGRNPLGLLNLLVTAFGLLVAYGAYETYKFGKRYGNMTFKLKTSPSFLGQELIGDFVLDKAMPVESDLKVTLTCRQLERQKGHDDTIIKILWQDTQIISANRNTMDDRFYLPIKFSLPDDLPQSGELSETVEIEWELQFSSKAFGYSQHREFKLPVFNKGGRSEVFA